MDAVAEDCGSERAETRRGQLPVAGVPVAGTGEVSQDDVVDVVDGAAADVGDAADGAGARLISEAERGAVAEAGLAGNGDDDVIKESKIFRRGAGAGVLVQRGRRCGEGKSRKPGPEEPEASCR